jgi:hypothetical protein
VDRQEPAAKVLWRIEEPPVARDPAEIAATLGELGCLDLVELGQEAVLERIVQAAATCCGSTGGWACCCPTPTSSCAARLPQGGPDAPWPVAGATRRGPVGGRIPAGCAGCQQGDLAGEPRWPNFRPLALAAGIRAWLSAPVRQRHGPIGALDFARIEQARDLIMERERLDEVARSSCCASRPRSRGSPSEPSPNASFPAPELDLHLPSSPPRWVAGGWHRTAAPPRARARQSR